MVSLGFELSDTWDGTKDIAGNILVAGGTVDTPAGGTVNKAIKYLPTYQMSKKEEANLLYATAVVISAVAAAIPGMQAPAAIGLAAAVSAIKQYAMEQGANKNLVLAMESMASEYEDNGETGVEIAEYIDLAQKAGVGDVFKKYVDEFSGGYATGKEVLELALKSAEATKQKYSRQWEVTSTGVREHVYPAMKTLEKGYFATKEEALAAWSASKPPLTGLKFTVGNVNPVSSGVILTPQEYQSLLEGVKASSSSDYVQNLSAAKKAISSLRTDYNQSKALTEELNSALHAGIDREAFMEFWAAVGRGDAVIPVFSKSPLPTAVPSFTGVIVDDDGFVRVLSLTKENTKRMVNGNLIVGKQWFPSTWFVL